MWQAMRLSQKTSPDFVSSAEDLVHTTTRNLIAVTGALYLIWHLFATINWPVSIGWRMWLLAPVVALVNALAWVFLRKKVLLAQVIWLVGMAAIGSLATVLLQEPRIALFLCLIPLMAVVTIGLPAGIIAELGIVGLTLLFASAELGFGPRLPFDVVLQVGLGGAVCGLVGWFASDALFTVIHWSLFSFNQARESMEEARTRRGQLAQVLKDLDQAYYRLERANTALVAAWKAAEEAERFKTELAANVSHELRTPLNLIIGFAEIMMTSPESYGNVPIPGAYRSDLNAIYNSAQHLLALVDDVLDLSRLEAGKMSLTRAEVNPGALIYEATNMVSDYVAAKGLELHVHVQDNLPGLWIDRLRIRQVLLNLLVNAARFTKQGSITVDAAQHGNEVMVRVKDTGQGIRETDLPHVFKEFQPTELRETGWHSGTGLGLPISRKFVTMHQGRMGVESAYLQGSTFWFALPCGSPESIGEGAVTLTRAEPVGRINDQERIVVLVHRDPTAPRLLQRYLDHHHLVGAETPEEGLALARDLKAIALLCDVREPLPDTTRDGPIVVRCHLPSSLEAAKTLGADQFLTKPVSREDLLAALERVGRPIKRILIADDDPEVVRLFQRMLRGRLAPQDCLEAYNGAEAWALLQTERPDVVLLDLMMPHMTGQEILARMAQDSALQNISVIVVSAHEQDYTPSGVPGLIEVQRKEAFQPGEMVRTLEGIFSALSPGWH